MMEFLGNTFTPRPMAQVLECGFWHGQLHLTFLQIYARPSHYMLVQHLVDLIAIEH